MTQSVKSIADHFSVLDIYLCKHWLDNSNELLVELTTSYLKMQVQLSNVYERGRQLKVLLCHF